MYNVQSLFILHTVVKNFEPDGQEEMEKKIKIKIELNKINQNHFRDSESEFDGFF